MPHAGYLSCLLLAVMGCGSTQTAPKHVSEDEPVSAKPTETAAAIPPPKHEAAPPDLGVAAAPIDVPKGLLYEGYVLGGLPSKAQIDEALAADIESALSLMARDEPGIAELARYATSKGFRYIRFTIAGPEDLSESMAWQFAATLPLLDKPGIVHSAEGQRVAAIFALKAFFVEERSAEEALAIGRALGMGEFEKHVRSLLNPGSR